MSPPVTASRLLLFSPILICASCSLIFEESKSIDDGGIAAIDAGSNEDANSDARPQVSCSTVSLSEALDFDTESFALSETPSGMTGMAVANNILYLADIGDEGPPKIWVADKLDNWLNASLLLDDPRLVSSAGAVGAGRIQYNLSEVSSVLAYSEGLGTQGSLLMVHENLAADDALKRRIARYDFETDIWSLLPAPEVQILISHSLTVLGPHVYGIQHAGGNPLIRFHLTDPDGQGVQETDTDNLDGDSPAWLSRAAQLAAGDGTLYAIKNDWCEENPTIDAGPSCAVSGNRLFAVDPSNFNAGGSTPASLSRELPFDIGHGSTLVFLPPGWAGRVGVEGALFLTDGRTPSNQEGLGPSAGKQYGIYDIACDSWHTSTLPSQSGSGASAVFFQDQLIIRPGGDPDENANSSTNALWVSGG